MLKWVAVGGVYVGWARTPPLKFVLGIPCDEVVMLL